MSMPNCVPQSPMWLVRVTSCPQNSKIRLMHSPMIVDRKCPTCMFLATLGDEKSTITLCFFTFGGSMMPLSTLLICALMKVLLR